MFQSMGLEIKKINLYETVTEKLEKMILTDSAVGEKLPSEQILAENFSVSRNIMRESLKILQERGLIDIRTGEGAFISKPKTKVLGDMVNRILLMGDMSLKDVYELRFVLEVAACGLAADRASENDVKELDDLIESMKKNLHDEDEWARLDLQFHTTIAKSTGNPLFYSFIKPLANSLESMSKMGYHKTGASQEGIKGHILIADAIKKRDKSLAEKVMFDHLERSKADVLNGSEE